MCRLGHLLELEQRGDCVLRAGGSAVLADTAGLGDRDQLAQHVRATQSVRGLGEGAVRRPRVVYRRPGE